MSPVIPTTGIHIVFEDLFPAQSVGQRRSDLADQRQDFVAGTAASEAAEERHSFARVDDVGSLLDFALQRHDRRARVHQRMQEMPAGNFFGQHVGGKLDAHYFLLGHGLLDRDLGNARHLHRIGK